MGKHYIMIEMQSIEAARAIQLLIEKQMPFLTGQLRIQSEAEVTTLDKIIQHYNKNVMGEYNKNV